MSGRKQSYSADVEGVIQPGTTWLAYLRDSGGERQTASCDQQDAVVREILERTGATLKLPPFRDEARRGSSTIGRAGLDALLLSAKPGVADGVIFWSSARMARELNDAQLIRAMLRKRGFELAYIADQVPNIGVWTPLLEVVQDIRNAQYLETLSKEIKRAHRDLLKLGYVPMGKHPPPGYRLEREQYGTHRDGTPMQGVRWVKDPATAPRVEQAWRMRLMGYSHKGVARATHLYSQSTSYQRIFANKLYMGTFVWGGVEFPNFVEPYVTAAEWERVQAIGAERNRFPPRELGNLHLLVGLLHCPVCGHRMTYHHIKHKGARGQIYHHEYYRCQAKRETGAKWCPSRMVRADHLEARVIEKIVSVYLDDQALEQLYAQWQAAPVDVGLEVERAQLTAALAKGEQETQNLLQLAKLGQYASVAAELAELEAAQQKRRVRLAELEVSTYREELPPVADFHALVAALQAALAGGELEAARLYLAKLVVRIELNPDGSPNLTLRRPSAR